MIKKFLIILFSLLIFNFNQVQSAPSEKNCFYKDGVKTQCKIKSSDKKNVKYGIENMKHEILLPVEFDKIIFFTDIAYLQKGDKKGYWSYEQEKTIIPVKYDEVAYYIKENIFIVKKDGLYKFYNIQKNKEENNSYFLFERITRNKFLVQNDNGYFIYNHLKNEHKKLPYQEIKKQENKGFIVKKQNKYGYLHYNGEELFIPQYKSIIVRDFFPEDIIITEDFDNKKSIYKVKNGELEKVTNTNYEDVKILSVQDFIVKQNDKYGVIMREKIILPIEFDKIENIGLDEFIVTKNGKQGIYHYEDIILDINYDKIEFLGYWDLYKVCQNNKCGLYDKKYNRTTELKYDDIIAINRDKFKVISGKKESIISRKTPSEKIKDTSKGIGVAIIWLLCAPFMGFF